MIKTKHDFNNSIKAINQFRTTSNKSSITNASSITNVPNSNISSNSNGAHSDPTPVNLINVSKSFRQ